MLSMRSVKCHQIKMVEVVSKLVMPNSVNGQEVLPTTKPSRGIFTVVRPSPYSRLYTVLMYKCS